MNIENPEKQPLYVLFFSYTTPHGSRMVINLNAALQFLIWKLYFNGSFHDLLYLYYIFWNTRIKKKKLCTPGTLNLLNYKSPPNLYLRLRVHSFESDVLWKTEAVDFGSNSGHIWFDLFFITACEVCKT